ncbi:SH3 domain [Lasallia pustulata]|uniref:SH3 domain n=1 Tax=Lasallia pustulata TaxID=136370 RepID=A0A1W5CT24_9LECA|nr:SH3 domain [Lasallia pustulata]
MSSYSTTSGHSQNRSRPSSHVFPVFHSSLTYTLVRDFAYPIVHPNHYGPPADSSAAQSGQTTPASEVYRRLSDPPLGAGEGSRAPWSATPWGSSDFAAHQQLPPTAYGDGPPYSEDEDLHSPVVISSRQKKHKSSFAAIGGGHGRGRGRGRGPAPAIDEGDPDGLLPENYDEDRGYFAGTNGDGSETYYISQAGETANGPGGELVTYPPDQARHPLLSPNTYNTLGQRDSHFTTTLPNRSYAEGEVDYDSDSDVHDFPADDSRYSRDYQFTIASPDEEMHGKAVALFDFVRENENELPLIEGQVIWVSYRHGQGWLVAEDPKTGESGLVPEEYVRLLRDIEGGWTSLAGEVNDERALLSPQEAGPDSADTPTQGNGGFGSAAPLAGNGGANTNTHNNNNNASASEKRPPIVSTFSTSSKDLNPYPHHLLGTQAGQLPPQVVHIGSRANTPTLTSPVVGSHVAPMELGRSGSGGGGSGRGVEAERREAERQRPRLREEREEAEGEEEEKEAVGDPVAEQPR